MTRGTRRTFINRLTLAASAGAMALGAIPPAMAQEAPPTPPVEYQRQAPKGAPNVVLVLLDDVGFGASSTFGGPALTPTLDQLSKDGLRYNRFHTTAICSPTRASLLSGRNPHAAGIWSFEDLSAQRPVKADLTGREREVAARLLEGLTSKEIGKALNISHRTVEIYRARLMRKYGASTAADLVHKLVA